MSLIERVHAGYLHDRRIRVLTSHLAALAPRGGRVLDVGCGDGLLAQRLGHARPDLELTGIDVLVRAGACVPVATFDGHVIPYEDSSFATVMLVDVLHHADDPMELLREAVRVSSRAVVIKDHTCNGWLAYPTLRFMDGVGNARHGVRLPYNYWPRQRWLDAIAALGLTVGEWRASLRLYPQPASLLFDRSLHFAARLDVH
jgi:SAM-dependent methyltransferase